MNQHLDNHNIIDKKTALSFAINISTNYIIKISIFKIRGRVVVFMLRTELYYRMETAFNHVIRVQRLTQMFVSFHIFKEIDAIVHIISFRAK